MKEHRTTPEGARILGRRAGCERHLQIQMLENLVARRHPRLVEEDHLVVRAVGELKLQRVLGARDDLAVGREDLIGRLCCEFEVGLSLRLSRAGARS